MNPARLLVLLVTLPLLLGGCEKKPVAEVEPELQKRGEYPDEIAYLKGSDTPYTGTQTYWHKNGKKILEATFKDGKFDGLLQRWHENGTKWSEGNYKDGKEDGLYVEWYKNGHKKDEIDYKDGKFDGLWVRWYENGQKKEEVNYKDNNFVIGSEKYWNSKGEPVATWQEAIK